jgi:ribonuclease HI
VQGLEFSALQVNGHKGAIFKSFTSKDEASGFLQLSNQLISPSFEPCPGHAAASGGGSASAHQQGTKRGRSPDAAVAAERAPKCAGTLSESSSEWIAYFDGGSRGNPGIAGAGACVLVDGDEVAAAVQVCRPSSTNNEAECLGALLAVRLIHTLVNGIRAGCVRLRLPASVTIHGDSSLIINQVKGLWQVRAPNLVGPITDVRSCSAQLQRALWTSHRGAGAPPSVQWAHVRRELNQRADFLSNVAMDAAAANQRQTSQGTPKYSPMFCLVQLVDPECTPDTLRVTGKMPSGTQWSQDAAQAVAWVPNQHSEAAVARIEALPLATNLL